jgi:hypothetical protein
MKTSKKSVVGHVKALTLFVGVKKMGPSVSNVLIAVCSSRATPPTNVWPKNEFY